MGDLATIGRLVFDLNQVETVIDRGDYILVEFHPFHRPPYLYFYGADAKALREWDRAQSSGNNPLVSQTALTTIRTTLETLDDLEKSALNGALSQEQALQLIATLRAVQKDRDELVTHNIALQNQLLDECAWLKYKHAGIEPASQQSSVRCTVCNEYLCQTGYCGCTRPEDCLAGHCSCTNLARKIASDKEGLPF
jgi:hypothetical protein